MTYKLKHLEDELADDFEHILSHYEHPAPIDERTAWHLLRVVSTNRAYDDLHPRWQDEPSINYKAPPRVLPYDGRDYCWYYEGGANDKHVDTLLRRVAKRLNKEGWVGSPDQSKE